MERLVLDFMEIDKTSLSYVGGKGANLGEMTKAGFPVPQGFCVTTSAFEAFIRASNEMEDFFERLDLIQADKLDAIRSLGQQIRDHLENLPIPREVEAALLEAWRRAGKEKAYAVRSSATAEDLPNASFAGQQETYLNVRGEKQLIDSMRRCFASLFTDRAISYRAKNGFDHRRVFLSVVVQEMVFPDVSGILFTADPISGNREITSIDASFGLGEALVSGLVSADLYQVRGGQIIEKKISKKKIGIFAVPEGGTVTTDLPSSQQEDQALADERILELAELGKRIESHYRTPQDIEWCLANGQSYIVQSRPITSLYPIPLVFDDRLHVFFSVGHQQMMTDAISPLGRSVLRTLLPFGKSGSVREESLAVLEAGGHLFFDPTELLYLELARRIFPRIISNVDERIGNAIAEVVQRPEFAHPVDERVKKTVYRLMRAAVKTVISRVFTRDLDAVRESMNAFVERTVLDCERDLFQAKGAERIAKIQESIGSVIVSFIQKVGPYMFVGMASMLLTKALVKRWLSDDDRVHLLNKSLPGNVTSELGLMIGDLADLARQHPQVVEYLQTARDDAFLAGLASVQGGDVFEQGFAGFLSKYGMRCPGEIDIANSRWRETPTALVPAILSHIRTMSSGEHRVKFAEGQREAEAVARGILADVRKTRNGFFKAKILSRLIHNYRNLAGLREHPKYMIIRHLDLYKRAILEEATALAKASVLRHESDVFYLSLNELLALVSGSFSGDVQELIADRKIQHEGHKKLSPPRVMTSVGEIVTGDRRNVFVPEGTLIGTPVSAGIVEGYAKVVLRPEEAQLDPGDIMIAPFTDPGWTPLFHAAKGLVMEVGGMMTHGAVVAREYGIPAVVGIDGATQVIRTGAYIRIDGSNGYVKILRDPCDDSQN